MNELYSIFVTIGLLLGCGLMLLFTVVPESTLLSNYRKARYMLAGAYLFFVAVEITKYLFLPARNVLVLQTTTITIAASQALLFTFAMLILIEVRFFKWRYIFREVIYTVAFITAVFVAYFLCPDNTFKVIFYVFVAIYALLLVRYALLFLKSYSNFSLRMDNYFSDTEVGHLRWVAFSFFTALAIGIMALLSSLFMSIIVILIFTAVFDTFYVFFAIRFINYANQFHIIERAINNEIPKDIPDAENNNTLILLEKRIGEWIASKGFTEREITIETLSERLHTNSKYLSIYINTDKNQNFREWISALRVEEAKILLLQYPKMSIDDISNQIGFSNKNNFHRHFIKHTNCNPQEWREKMK